MTESKSFSSIPLIDFSLASNPSTRPQLIHDLRHALITVGFLYLSHTPVSQTVVQRLIADLPRFFALSDEEKARIAMVNSPHFLGYTSLGKERTRGKADIREQIDIATPHECQWQPGKPEYLRLWGPSQWPDEALIPGFRTNHEDYLRQVSNLAKDFVQLFAEALGLPPDGLDKFYGSDAEMQHRSKLVQYPASTADGGDGQGVGPHYDAGFVTILLQASDHPGLQVQNLAGEWVDVPPIPETFVVNIGKALEFATQGVARATSHRVVSPPSSSTGPRYSVPFFHNIGLGVRLTDEKYKLEFPEDVKKLRDERGSIGKTDSVNFTEFDQETSGMVNLIGRVKSHPDVGERHYPELFKKYFPDGLPSE